MGAAEVTAFLTSLAVHSKVAASTQNQALSALLFLYREVLGVELPWLDDVVRAKRPPHLPVVLTRNEVRAPALRSRPPATPSVTRSPPTCWRRVTTSAPCRNCSATRTSAPR
jgi:hypothetical protein